MFFNNHQTRKFIVQFDRVSTASLHTSMKYTATNSIHALAVYLHLTLTAPFQSEAHLESIRTSAMEPFCENNQRLQAIGYFLKRAPLWMLDMILYATLSKNLLQLTDGLRRRFTSLGLHKGILDSHCFLFLLIYIIHKTKRSNLGLIPVFISLPSNCASVQPPLA